MLVLNQSESQRCQPKKVGYQCFLYVATCKKVASGSRNVYIGHCRSYTLCVGIFLLKDFYKGGVSPPQTAMSNIKPK